MEQIIRGEVGRLAHLWSPHGIGTIGESPEQPAVRPARATFGENPARPARGRLRTAGAQRAAPDSIRGGPLIPLGELTVEIRDTGEDVIVVVSGEFDLATAEAVREALARAIDMALHRLVLDLRGLTFIDSIGLQAVIDAYKDCRDRRLPLVLRPGPPHVHRLFVITRADHNLPFRDT